MDSTRDTLKHISTVKNYICVCIKLLGEQMIAHDRSKLETPEVEVFDEFANTLNTKYWGEEYQRNLELLKPALDHHYKNNPHHPEYHENGVEGMDLMLLIEMLCDWMAAVKRNSDGDIFKSIETNQTRFNYSNEIKSILINTVRKIHSQQL